MMASGARSPIASSGRFGPSVRLLDRNGDLAEGELEIGQVSGMIDDVPTVAEVMARLDDGYAEAAARLG